jgi:hypothetical protein
MEEIYHYCAAVSCITSFFLIHALMSSCMHLYVRDNIEYDIVKNIYLALTVIFFVLWIADTVFSTITVYTKLMEWILLFTGVCLHCYALFFIQQAYDIHSSKIKVVIENPDPTGSGERTFVFRTMVWLCVGFVTIVLFSITSTLWSVGSDSVHLRTGVEFWIIVSTTYLMVMYLLEFERFNM